MRPPSWLHSLGRGTRSARPHSLRSLASLCGSFQRRVGEPPYRLRLQGRRGSRAPGDCLRGPRQSHASPPIVAPGCFAPALCRVKTSKVCSAMAAPPSLAPARLAAALAARSGCAALSGVRGPDRAKYCPPRPSRPPFGRLALSGRRLAPRSGAAWPPLCALLGWCGGLRHACGGLSVRLGRWLALRSVRPPGVGLLRSVLALRPSGGTGGPPAARLLGPVSPPSSLGGLAPVSSPPGRLRLPALARPALGRGGASPAFFRPPAQGVPLPGQRSRAAIPWG